MLISKFQDILHCFPEHSLRVSVIEATHPQTPAGAPVGSSLALCKGLALNGPGPVWYHPSGSVFVPEGNIYIVADWLDKIWF